MNAIEPSAPYILCASHCGKAISDPRDHDLDCSAPLAERTRIERELRILKARSSEAALAAADEIKWRCSCGEEFESQDVLGGHHTDTGHQGMWMVDADGETEDGEPAEIRTEVDAKPARIRRGRTLAPASEKPEWRELPVPEAWILEAQFVINVRSVNLGGLAAGKKCSGRQVIDGYEIECPHSPALRTVETSECDLHKKHTATLDQLCLIHAIRLLAGNLAPAGNGPLFEAVENA